MPEHKHTPGPWEIVGSHVYTNLGAKNRAGSQAADTDGWNVATIAPWACTNADGEDEDMAVTESMANACLVAAAPDLLEALSSAESWISGSPHGDNCFVSSHGEGDPGNRCNCGKDSVLEFVCSAIAKATGQA
jgi:hypothetical protein